MNPDEIRAAIEYLDACLQDIHQRAEGRALDETEQRQWDEGMAERARLHQLLERHNELARLAQQPAYLEMPENRGPEVIRKVDPFEVIEDRGATTQQLSDAATRAIEARVDKDNQQAMGHVRRVLQRHLVEDDESGLETMQWARNLVGRTHPHYISGFRKYITGRQDFWTPEERAAMVVGTNTGGGFLVPTHLDPTIILTNDGTSNAIRAISRQVTLTEGNVWNGVTSAGVTGSFDDELEEVSDDSPTFARASVPVHRAQVFAQASIEAFQDIGGLTSDVLMLFADARDRLEGAKHATGSGSGEPTGIFTALDANTNVEIVSDTAAAIFLADLQELYRSVPVRYRNRATWLMHPIWLLAIQSLGQAVSASFSTDLTQPLTNRIIGRPVVESDDAPSAASTTTRDNEIIFGDFSNYVIVDKPGSFGLEFIPHLFNTATNLPDGRRGWYAFWRTGADSVNDLAFRLLQDKTSG